MARLTDDELAQLQRFLFALERARIEVAPMVRRGVWRAGCQLTGHDETAESVLLAVRKLEAWRKERSIRFAAD